MKTELKVAVVQTNIISDYISGNLAQLEEQLWNIDQEIDLIILPEAFNTGFNFKKMNIEPANFHTMKWMKQMAQLKNAYIAGSYFLKEDQKVRNRLYCVGPDGSIQYYDKFHLFTFSEEINTCTKGTEIIDFNIYGWKTRASICFDLRFPVFLRNTTKYDILLNVANWPADRIIQYQKLAQARAIENQCYVITCNRLGTDQKDIRYDGKSAFYDYKGELLNTISDSEKIIIFTLKKDKLSKARDKFPILEEQDVFKLAN